jgi:hypothetical protein
LPPQKSAADTSNWDNRNVSAPIVDIDKRRQSTRSLKFMKNKIQPNDIVLRDT